MISSVGDISALVLAGVLAGVVGTAGGITSLVSYPALLAAGVPALQANVVNLVAFVACWPGSALTSRRELTRPGWVLSRGLPAAACGAAAGAALLLTTPAGVFSYVVPFLVAVGSLALLVQPWLTSRLHRYRGKSAVALPLIVVVSIYSGYFGAGAGVMVLALLLCLVDDRLPEANAVKNMLVGAGAVAAAAVFVSAGPVDWTAVAPLATGLFVGSIVGPIVARRVPPAVVRWSVAALGIGLAVELWVNPG